MHDFNLYFINAHRLCALLLQQMLKCVYILWKWKKNVSLNVEKENHSTYVFYGGPSIVFHFTAHWFTSTSIANESIHIAWIKTKCLLVSTLMLIYFKLYAASFFVVVFFFSFLKKYIQLLLLFASWVTTRSALLMDPVVWWRDNRKICVYLAIINRV